MLFSALEPDGRGGTVRRYAPLPLERNKVTFFPLSWTIVHPIDGASPLAGQTPRILERDARPRSSSCSLASTRRWSRRSTRDRRIGADEIVWNARFRSMFLAAGSHARVSVDISRVHEIERL